MSFLRTCVPVFAVGALFLGAMLFATDGRPSLPLDDSFIYFQYAKQTAAGQPLIYQPGEAPTTGATSLPWMLLLSIGALLGFGGKSMIFLAMLLGGLAFAVAVHATGLAQQALAPRKPGSQRPGDLGWFGMPLAALLVWLCGPLQWGAWSGMEIPMFTAAIAVAFLMWVRAAGRPTPGAAVALAVLAVTRPEGALLAMAAALLWVLGAVMGRADSSAEPEAGRARPGGVVWILLPLAASLVVPLIAWVTTGDYRTTGFVAKSLLALPGADLFDVLRVALLRAASLSGVLFAGIAPFADGLGLYAYDSESAHLFVAPGAGLLFLIGVLPALSREWTERRGGPGILSILWIGGLILATCLLGEPDAHFSRYQMPILPLFLLWVSSGVGRVTRVARESLAGLPRIGLGIRIYLIGFGVVSVLFFAGAYGDNCRDIDRMQIMFGESLRETLEADDVVAINDAGAIAYFSGRRTLDLIGLTTPGFAGLWGQGSGVLWEKLEALPERDRPNWFCVFPNWFEFDGLGLLRRVGSVRLLKPSIVDAEKVLYRADWSLAGSGGQTRLAASSADGADASAARIPAILDAVDVADPDSEREHHFTFDDGEPGAHGGSFVRRAGFAHLPGEIIDGGRTVMREVTFEIARDPLAPTRLVARTVTGIRQRLRISVDGAEPVAVELYAPGAGRFHDQVVAELPPGAEPARVRIRLEEGAARTAPLVLAHLFSIEAE